MRRRGGPPVRSHPCLPCLPILAMLAIVGVAGCGDDRDDAADGGDRIAADAEDPGAADAGDPIAADAGDLPAADAASAADGGADPELDPTPPAVDPVIQRPPPPEIEDARAAAAPPPVSIPEDPPTFERPEGIRGLYLNAWAAGSPGRLQALIDVARRTEINTFVIDVKDVSGHVSYSTAVPLARRIGAVAELRISDITGLLRRLRAEGIYPIARIVVTKDPILATARPSFAMQDTAGGVWRDQNRVVWLNPFDPRVRAYHMDLAREAVALGFPEIQWDYIRFPDAPNEYLARADYPGRDGRPRPAAIRDFLRESNDVLGEMGAYVGADVFGVTTSAYDIGIGQIWEQFIDVVDAALPMVYPSHYYPGSFGIQDPNGHPYEIIREALRRAVDRTEGVEGAGEIVPWLQDFDLGEPAYDAPEVRAQIQATYDVGLDDWILWNPSSRYTEDALQPADGWRREPRIRVGGRIVRVSRREDALRWAEEERRRDRMRVDTIRIRDTLPP